ncbi:hypothetical protein [Plastoroseomonas arctica]|uniref:Calcineurin-like phosphoesterase domain-containing protein n=1 Tax=Plastoroseomonas arctica TaxID=1509237 RepID=A0AAF1JYH9_9PROT|nr:hypothetical protein [Plastoroseomonas arctica]MBR0653540.1 hypothetical protein [Plastoroseomonas arctica]
MLNPARVLFTLALLALPLAAQAQPFTFLAFGDMPYCRPGDAAHCEQEQRRLDTLIGRMNAAQPAFSVFLGDTKAGNEACTDAIVFVRTARWFGLFDHPLVYTPGDNEWTDCWQPRAGGHDPVAILARLRQAFFARPESLGRVTMPLTRQADIDPANTTFVENARWEHHGVVFATVHVVGSDNNRPPETGAQPPGAAEEFPARDAANRAWVAAAFAEAERTGASAMVLMFQSDMFFRDRCGFGDIEGVRATRAAIAEAAARFARPVLLLHGDSHFFLADYPLRDGSNRVLGNVLRVMVPGAEDIRAVRIEVDPTAAEPFAIAPLGIADRPRGPTCP